MTSDDGVSVFERVRPRLFGIAYRILGSAAEAEDIVQDAWLRWALSAVRGPIKLEYSVRLKSVNCFGAPPCNGWLQTFSMPLLLET